MALSPEIQELIVKARIMDFSAYPQGTIATFQAADDQRLYLTDAELAELAALMPDRAAIVPVVQLLRDRAVDIVDAARVGVLAQFPTILAVGGGLYPPERADACWRDFWQFLRCVSYGIAAGQTQYTSPTGLAAMQQLYVALAVPLAAMIVGLEGLKSASLTQVTDQLGPADAATLAPYFDHLIDRLKQFRTGPDIDTDRANDGAPRP
jgi:Phycobilisome protein